MYRTDGLVHLFSISPTQDVKLGEAIQRIISKFRRGKPLISPIEIIDQWEISSNIENIELLLQEVKWLVSETSNQKLDDPIISQKESSTGTSPTSQLGGQTSIDEDLLRLQKLYTRVLTQPTPMLLFTNAIASIDWNTASSTLFEVAIDTALALENPTSARRLAALGYQLHPTNKVLERAASILAPPTVVRSVKTSKTQEPIPETWFQEHSHEYRGQWVALKRGQLMGAAGSRKDLIQAIGTTGADEDILITRIL